MNESAWQKIENLKTLQENQDSEIHLPITVDEDGFYYIGENIFTDFKSALKYLKK